MKVHWRAAEIPEPCGILYPQACWACWKLVPPVSFIWKWTSLKWERLTLYNFNLGIQMIMSPGNSSGDQRPSGSQRKTSGRHRHCKILHCDDRHSLNSAYTASPGSKWRPLKYSSCFRNRRKSDGAESRLYGWRSTTAKPWPRWNHAAESFQGFC